MKWYVASLIIECRVGREAPELWDEQIVTIRAVDDEAAYLEARRIGKNSETSYKNHQGQTVRWKFRGLADLEELLSKTIRSGTEIHSSLVRGKRKRPRIPEKKQLTVFWGRRVANKKAKDLLTAHVRRFAPR